MGSCPAARGGDVGCFTLVNCQASEHPSLTESGVSYQLLQVVLYCVRVNHNADGHQGVESKVKYLVAEKWDNPGGTQLKQT